MSLSITGAPRTDLAGLVSRDAGVAARLAVFANLAATRTAEVVALIAGDDSNSEQQAHQQPAHLLALHELLHVRRLAEIEKAAPAPAVVLGDVLRAAWPASRHASVGVERAGRGDDATLIESVSVIDASTRHLGAGPLTLRGLTWVDGHAVDHIVRAVAVARATGERCGQGQKNRSSHVSSFGPIPVRINASACVALRLPTSTPTHACTPTRSNP